MLHPSKPKGELVARCVEPRDDYIPDFYRLFYCYFQKVVEALVEEIAHWTPVHPVLIDAPTGRGKSHLFKTELIPRALAQGKTILIISNRVALSCQQKIEILEVLNSPMRKYLTDEGIRNTERFGSVAIVTYHRLPAFLADPENEAFIENLLYVVADECHMMTSDSGYNDFCGYYLKLLTTKFKHAVRIYMTATAWDILYPLAEAEKSSWRNYERVTGDGLLKREFRLYQFVASYAHIDLKFFASLESIKKELESNTAEKSIVFIDNKQKGKPFADSLSVKTLYLDKDSKESPEWAALLTSQKFDDYDVLVTTPALDCGINVWDSRVKHIYVVTDDRAALIQMIGRKRCEAGEKITVHVQDLPESKLAARYKHVTDLLDQRARYEQAGHQERHRMANELWRSDDKELRLYFQLANGNLVINELAFHKLMRKVKFYERILNHEVTFQDEVRLWLGKGDMSSPQQAKAELMHFCHTIEDQEIEEDCLDILRKLAITAASLNGYYEDHPERLPDLGYDGINTRMQYVNAGYGIVKTNKKLYLRRK
jgi:superfamily II DNA or RNA helicase